MMDSFEEGTKRANPGLFNAKFPSQLLLFVCSQRKNTWKFAVWRIKDDEITQAACWL